MTSKEYAARVVVRNGFLLRYNVSRGEAEMGVGAVSMDLYEECLIKITACE